MSRLLPSLKAQAQPQPEQNFRAITNPSVAGRPYRDYWDTERAIREGMQRITWVYRCVHLRAVKSARLPIVMREGNPYTGDLVEDHALLPLLNAYPNDEEAAFIFRYRLSAQLDLNRRGAFIELLRSRLDDVLAMRLLPPETVPVPGTNGKFLDRYEVMVGGRVAFTCDPKNVVWVRNPHPTDPYGGTTPMEAAGIAIDTEWASKVFQRSFLQNNMANGGFLFVAGSVSPDDVDELQARVDARSGPRSAGRWVVMEATALDSEGNPTGEVGGMHPVPASVTPQEASFLDLRKYGKDEICGAFGMPVSIATMQASDRTFDNADAEERNLWRHTIIDHCEMIDRPFDRIDGDPSTFVGRDVSSIWVLKRDEIEYQKHLMAQVDGGEIVADEFREEVGRDPFAEGGDVVYKPITLTPVSRLNASGSKSLEDKSQESLVAYGRFSVDGKRLESRRKERLRQIVTFEKQTKRIMTNLFDRQERATLEKLRGTKARHGTRHWRVEVEVDGKPVGSKELAGVAGGSGAKVIGASDIFDRDRWNEQVSDDLGGMSLAIAQHFSEDAFETATDATKAADSPKHDAESARILAFFDARKAAITTINDTTYDAIAAALTEGEDAGETMDELAGRVSSVFDDAKGARAETIARTETIAAANAGAVDGMEQSGVVVSKTWLATADERTRETHAEADGQEVGLDEDFEVGDGTLAYPGDPAGDPSETVNCRCTVIGATDEDVLL